MVTSGDVTVAQEGGQGNVKLHPYFVTLVRWCVSCVWSTATVLLHRLMTTPLQPITGPKPVPRAKIPRRVAGTEHLHPEPRVECQLLHHPAIHTMDVIFVHGLYGSLGNTWRQGDWRQKYVSDPKIVTLRDHNKQNRCNCHKDTYKNHNNNKNKCNIDNSFTNHMHNEIKCEDANITDLDDPEMSYKQINEKLAKKVIPEENDLITEQFYNNTLMDQVDTAENFDTQAKFVRDMFKKETNCDKSCENNTFKYEDVKFNCENDNDFKCTYVESDTFKYDDNGFKCNRNVTHEKDNDLKCNNEINDFNECKCTEKKCEERNNDFKCKYKEINDINECKCTEKKCEAGCGCVCNDCYSTCWPRDWIKVDFPGARVISINYTSDPYLWRPLWIKENKRLNLYQRAEQMIEQLLKMGVGEKPIVWVGHSKGGLFIKQIYCEAYEAYMKKNKGFRTNPETKQVNSDKNKESLPEIHNGITAENIDTIIGHFSQEERKQCHYTEENDNYKKHNDNYSNQNDNYTKESDDYRRNQDNIANNNSCVMNETIEYSNVFKQISAKNDNLDIKEINDNVRNIIIENGDGKKLNEEKSENDNLTLSIEECALSRRASLWSSSRGFMFYSVPHRGSPLADIKTPVTARSVDLLEIAKDCPLVLELQSRWEQAVGPVGTRAPPAVRSVVETCRTLMSVLWLRIVSTDSADAGIGTLSGISVDHREICKPAGRGCPLYTTLTRLIQDATCTCH